MRKVLVVISVIVFSVIALAAFAEEKESVYFVKEREKMIKYLRAAGISDQFVIDAMSRVHRQEFVPKPKDAYKERSFKIGSWAVAASPYITAMRLNALRLRPGEKVLEIGTETGYQAALMTEIGGDVYSIELDPKRAEKAEKVLRQLGYNKINLRAGDGFDGWSDAAPFDAIIFACTPDDFPPKLVEQLKEGGRMILSLGKLYGPQTLIFAWKENGKMKTRPLADIKAPPMRGKISK